MSDGTEYFTIGQLARRTGVPVRTIRFWSDIGVSRPPAGRRPATASTARSRWPALTLSAQERQQIIDEFVDRAFAGIDPGAPAMGIACSMRQLPAELPDDPNPEQVDARVELGAGG